MSGALLYECHLAEKEGPRSEAEGSQDKDWNSQTDELATGCTV